MRDLVEGVVHAAPFVSAGQPARFSIRVEVALRGGRVRGSFSLFDAAGVPRGVSTVDDATCDGVHLKLAASIALLLSPRPAARPSPCLPGAPAAREEGCSDAAVEAAREEARADARERALQDVRERELPRLLAEARRAEEERARSTLRAVIGAGPLAVFHFTAEPARGFWLAGEARSERWSLLAEVRVTFPARTLTLADGRSTLDLASASGVVAPCLRWRWLAGCALVEVGGVLVAAAYRGDRSRSGASSAVVPALAAGDGSSAFLGLGGRVRLDMPIAFGLEARLFADVVGHPVGLTIAVADPTSASDPTGASGASGVARPAIFSLDAPREVSAFVGLGLARSFD